MTRIARRRELLANLLAAHPEPLPVAKLARPSETRAILLSHLEAMRAAGHVEALTEEDAVALTPEGKIVAEMPPPRNEKPDAKPKRAAKKGGKKSAKRNARAADAPPAAVPTEATTAAAERDTRACDATNGKRSGEAKPAKPKPRQKRPKLEDGQCFVTRNGNYKFPLAAFPDWARAEPIVNESKRVLEIAEAQSGGVKVIREARLAAVNARGALNKAGFDIDTVIGPRAFREDGDLVIVDLDG